jgi:hypothetical protein
MPSAEALARRVLASGRGFDYWESGMDLGLANDYYDSFITYQKLLLKEFDRMSGEYGFHVVDASRPLKRVGSALRRSIAPLIQEAPPAAEIVKPTNVSPITRIPPPTTPSPEPQPTETELREEKSA